MIRRMAGLLVFGFATAVASAQLSFGFRAGVAWANQDSPQLAEWDTKARIAPAFGLLLHAPITPRIGIQPEAAFVSRGYMQDLGTSVQGPSAQHIVFDFIDVNALFAVRLASEPVRPHLFLGPTLGLMTGARVLTESDGYVSGGSVLDPVKLRLNRTVFGLCGGVGFLFSTGASWLSVEGRYAYGLSDIWNGLTLVDVNGTVIREIHSYDRSLSLSIAWLMPVAKRAVMQEGTN